MRTTVFVLAAAIAAGSLQAAELTETDLAALRYFISIDDTTSVEAELKRLEAEFPATDIQGTLNRLTDRKYEFDTTPIWQRIDANDFDGARGLIEAQKTADPEWVPPPHMLAVMDAKEGQIVFDAAFDRGDLNGLLTALSAHPSIMTCERINNPWRLAELQVADERITDAIATYDGILRTCSEEDFLVATLQKAHAAGDRPQVESLFATAKAQHPNLRTRLDELETELFGPEAEAVQVAAAPAPPSPASLQASRAGAAAERGDWATCLSLTANAISMDAVKQHGWCAYNAGQARQAIADFSRVAAGGGAGAREATYGLILAYARSGQPQKAASIAASAQLTAQQRRVVESTVISKLAISSFESGNYRDALKYIDRLEQSAGSLDRGMTMLRGWSLLKTRQKSAARAVFRRVHDASPGKDSFQGLVESR